MSYLDILRRLEQDTEAQSEPLRPKAEGERPALVKKETSPPEPERPALAPGCRIWWRSADGRTRGPALLQGTFEDHGQVWGWFALAGVEYLIRTDLIVKIQRPEDE